MARHRLKHISAAWKGERQSIGDVHVDNAIAELKRTALKTAAVMTHYPTSRESTLRMLFDDADLEKLRAVRGMVKTLGTVRSYNVAGAVLHINFDGATVPAIEDKVLNINYERVTPLLTYIKEVKAIHDRFEEVKGLLRWFNRNATPGAIRYYWPTALKICPKSRAWEGLQEVPTRFDNPVNIQHWLQSIKDAAATVAGSLLLPNDAQPKTQDQMWLSFEEKRVDVGPGPGSPSFYKTDVMTYNL